MRHTKVRVPLVIHLPHASTAIPDDAMRGFCVSTHELRRHVALMTDHFTDDLFATDLPDAVAVRHEVSRLVVDPERFECDDDEPMAARGQDVLYERGADGSAIRARMIGNRRERLLDAWYRPHHRRLESAVASALGRIGRVLIIDAHSFPDEPLALDADQRRPRPDVCIGTAGSHTPPELIEAARDWCLERGWSLGVDWPYAGTMVPMAHFGRDFRVMSIIIEINRARYMRLAGEAATKTAGYTDIRAFVGGLIDRVLDAVAEVPEDGCGDPGRI